MASSAPPDSSSESPSMFSPGKKRKRSDNSSSEEYVHDDYLGDLIKSRVPGTATYSNEGLDVEAYRVGGHELPMLPIKELETHEQRLNLFNNRVAPDLVKRLKEYSLWPTNPVFRMITLVSEARPDAEPHPYAYIELQWYDGCQQQWIKAADAMHSKLKQLRHPWIKVLLADPRAMATPFSKAIPVDDPLLKTWPSVADKILEAVSPRKDWLTLDLLVPGKEWDGEKDKEKIKAVLLIHYDTLEDWDGAFLQESRRAISSDPLYQQRSVELEVLRGYLPAGISGPFDTSHSSAVSHGDDIFDTIPYVGASICSDSYVGSGSFVLSHWEAQPSTVSPPAMSLCRHLTAKLPMPIQQHSGIYGLSSST